MSSLPQVADALQHVVTEAPERRARPPGCCQRRSTLTAAAVVQALVLGWLGTPTASPSELTQVAAKRGATVGPQALAQRFTPAAARSPAGGGWRRCGRRWPPTRRRCRCWPASPAAPGSSTAARPARRTPWPPPGPAAGGGRGAPRGRR